MTDPIFQPAGYINSSDIPESQDDAELDSKVRGIPMSTPKDLASSSVASPNFFVQIITWHPFTDYYTELANHFYPPDENDPGTKFQEFQKKHKWHYRFSVFLDSILMLTIIVFALLFIFYAVTRVLGVQDSTPARDCATVTAVERVEENNG